MKEAKRGTGIEEINIVKNKLSTLYWDKKKNALMVSQKSAGFHPLQAQRYKK